CLVDSCGGRPADSHAHDLMRTRLPSILEDLLRKEADEREGERDQDCDSKQGSEGGTESALDMRIAPQQHPRIWPCHASPYAVHVDTHSGTYITFDYAREYLQYLLASSIRDTRPDG